MRSDSDVSVKLDEHPKNSWINEHRLDRRFNPLGRCGVFNRMILENFEATRVEDLEIVHMLCLERGQLSMKEKAGYVRGNISHWHR